MLSCNLNILCPSEDSHNNCGGFLTSVCAAHPKLTFPLNNCLCSSGLLKATAPPHHPSAQMLICLLFLHVYTSLLCRKKRMRACTLQSHTTAYWPGNLLQYYSFLFCRSVHTVVIIKASSGRKTFFKNVKQFCLQGIILSKSCHGIKSHIRRMDSNLHATLFSSEKIAPFLWEILAGPLHQSGAPEHSTGRVHGIWGLLVVHSFKILTFVCV